MLDYFYELVPIAPRRDNNLKDTAGEGAGPERMCEHPMWMRLEDLVIRALEPFMEARIAAARALDEAQPVNST
jgi:hypothetical protein